jgi:signal transduction histidine kinase
MHRILSTSRRSGEWATDLTRSAASPRSLHTLPVVARALAALLIALVPPMALVEILVRPPLADLVAIGVYLGGSAIAAFAAGLTAVSLLDRARINHVHARIVLGAVVGAVVGLISVYVVARLMFVSTGHDLRLLLALLVFSSLVSFAFSWSVASRISGELDRVARRIRALIAGEYTPAPAPHGPDELSHLGRDVEELASRLQDAANDRAAMEGERRALIAAISHDLRTPLASIRAMTEALIDGVVTAPDEVLRYHQSTRSEVERLSRMVDDLFQLAQLEANVLPLQLRSVSLRDIAAEVVEAMRARAHSEGLELTLTEGEALRPTMVDGTLLERAIGNLISNAIEGSRPGGAVVLEVVDHHDTQILRVSDSGSGIEESELARIWEPFYRTERARTRRPGQRDGAGLGLAIVRGVAEAHGGRVSVRSHPGRGSTFSFEIPARTA